MSETGRGAQATPPFGALRPTAFQNWWRRRGAALPDSTLGRKLASLILGPAGGRARRAYDVEIFGGLRARLRPFDNICEKRVYLSPQHWDARERAFLADRVAAGAGPLTFVDIGANAGLYSLFAAGAARAAGRAIRIVAIEPDPEMRARMAFNFAASAIDASILPYAATAQAGPVLLAIDEKSRGQSRLVEEDRLAEAGGARVEGAPIHALLGAEEISSVDVMKIDIEGWEFPALDAFFAAAPATLWPALLMVETSHDASAAALAEKNGYRIALKTPLNTVLAR